MAIRPINTLKGWYVTAAKPIQQQFWDWIDSFRHRDEKIGWNDLDDPLKAMFNSFGRVIILPDGTYSVKILAGTLVEKFFIGEYPALHGAGSFVYTVSVGLTPGGHELFEDVPVDVTNDPNSGILNFDGHYCLADTFLYFTCTPPIGEVNKAMIKIYKS